MQGLRPFFPYYGSKWRAALHYPTPRYDHIIEPFAGSACYSLRHFERQVTLVDCNPIIYGVWLYILGASEQAILTLPENIPHIDGVGHLSNEERWLIGFWLNHGTATPSLTPSAWMRKGQHKTSFWGPEIKERILRQREKIKHWTILCRGYHQIGNGDPVTWFIDPPYQLKGEHYANRYVDYKYLGEWCKGKNGQVIVCEQDGADWLPFKPFRDLKSTKGKSKEVVWVRD